MKILKKLGVRLPNRKQADYRPSVLYFILEYNTIDIQQVVIYTIRANP